MSGYADSVACFVCQKWKALGLKYGVITGVQGSKKQSMVSYSTSMAH